MNRRLTQREQETLLRRYFAGEMSTEEEEVFFLQVAIDTELRRLMKSHTIVRSALEELRTTPSADHHDGRARLVAALSAERTSRSARHETGSVTEHRNLRRWLPGSLCVVVFCLGLWVLGRDAADTETTAGAEHTVPTVTLPDDHAAAKGSRARVNTGDTAQPLPRSIPVTGNSAQPAQTQTLPPTQQERGVQVRQSERIRTRTPAEAVATDSVAGNTPRGIRIIESSSVPDTIHLTKSDTVAFRLRIKSPLHQE